MLNKCSDHHSLLSTWWSSPLGLSEHLLRIRVHMSACMYYYSDQITQEQKVWISSASSQITFLVLLPISFVGWLFSSPNGRFFSSLGWSRHYHHSRNDVHDADDHFTVLKMRIARISTTDDGRWWKEERLLVNLIFRQSTPNFNQREKRGSSDF